MQLIGKITGVHGVNGEITFAHSLRKNTKFDLWDCLMIELLPGSYIPFFIESIKPFTSKECLCKLEEIDDREEAKKIINKNIYASMNYTIEAAQDNSLQKYIGFTVYEGDEKIGIIIDSIEGGMNNMFVVDHNGKEILLPSQKDLIVSIHPGNKIIHMTLPEGLLDL